MAEDKVLIYRPLGDFPPRTAMGDLEIGRVHSVTPKIAEQYAKKNFVVVTSEEAALIRAGKTPERFQPAHPPVAAPDVAPPTRPTRRREQEPPKTTNEPPAGEGGN